MQESRADISGETFFVLDCPFWERVVVLSLDCSSSFDATTLVGVEDTDISVCVRSVGGSGLQITIPGPRAKERC